MPRSKRDPIVEIVEYFETAEPVAKQQAYALITAIMRRDQPATPKKRAVQRHRTPASPSSPVLPPAMAGSGSASLAKPRTRRKPQDVPLPGLPGPVSEVGG